MATGYILFLWFEIKENKDERKANLEKIEGNEFIKLTIDKTRCMSCETKQDENTSVCPNCGFDNSIVKNK